MPAILQRSVCRKMSTDKENSKSEDIKVEENAPKDEDKVHSIEDSDEKSAEESEDKEKEPPKKKNAKVKETKKEVKSEGDDEDGDGDGDEDEDDDEEEEDGDEKAEEKVPLLDQPLQLSGTRERKKVQRFTEEFKAEPKDNAAVEIPEGKGTAFGSIPRIEANIQKYKADALKPLHRVLFNRAGKSATMKKYIRKFSGFDFDKDSDQFEKKKQSLQKLEVKVLKTLCDVLDVERKGVRDEIAERLAIFLLEPKDSGKPLPKSRPKRSTAKINNKSYSESDDEDDGKRPSRSHRGKGKRPNLKEDSSSEETEEKDKDKKDEKGKDSDADMEEEESPSTDEEEEFNTTKSKKKKLQSKGTKATAKKANAKKAPSKKTEKKPTPKKRKSSKSDEEDSSEDDEPLAKKAKAPPTDDEIKTYVKEILEGANLEEITMKTVCKQVYAHYPDFDLAHKKDFIKTTVKSLIST